MSNEIWHKVRTKVYYAEYRRGKVGEIVKCWFGNTELMDGQIVMKRANGDITVADEREFFRNYEEIVVKEKTP